MTTMIQTADQRGRMSLWRLEWLRLTRTPRALTLGAVFVFFGLLEPAMTRYQSQIFRHIGNGVRISFPAATPVQGISSYASEISGIGLIVVVVLAAGALSFDSHHGLATFLRTRSRNMWQLLEPRAVVCSAASALAYAAGTFAAWGQTSLLIGAPAAGGVLAGILCGAVYLAFAVAVTALAASVVRSTLAAAGTSLAVLLLLPVAGTFRAVSDWLPSMLASAPASLASGAHQLSHYGPAFAVTAVAMAAALAVATLRLRAREI
jgi:ABC-2 type transport system permease protein